METGFRAEHPLIVETLARPQSTGALQKLLRDPLGHFWKEVLRWREPQDEEEPITLDPLARGELVHAVFEAATRRLEAGPGVAHAGADRIAEVAAEAAAAEEARERLVAVCRVILGR